MKKKPTPATIPTARKPMEAQKDIKDRMAPIGVHAIHDVNANEITDHGVNLARRGTRRGANEKYTFDRTLNSGGGCPSRIAFSRSA